MTAQQPVLVLMGVSGSGKSTVAALLAGRLGWDFAEGDDLHPPENVAKMAAGHPLDDDDRRPWLERVRAWIAEHIAAGRPGIITCSALKRRYREVLRAAGPEHVVFVHLSGERERIATRMTARIGHYMPTSLLDSQIADLEPLEPDENGIVVSISGTPAEEASHVVDALGLVPSAG